MQLIHKVIKAFIDLFRPAPTVADWEKQAEEEMMMTLYEKGLPND